MAILSKSTLISLEEAICWAHYEHDRILEKSQIPWERLRTLYSLRHWLSLEEFKDATITHVEIE